MGLGSRGVHSARRLASVPILFILVFSAIAQDQHASSSPVQKQMGSRKNYVGLPNFGEVTPHLFRGGQPGVDGLQTLKKMGVTIVVDMRGSKSTHEKEVVTGMGMQYVSIPWHCPFPKDDAFAKFLHVVQENPKTKIFVHCRLGDDRTGMAVASYRMALEGWSAEDAMKEMELFGFRGVHHAICPGLASYEKNFPNELKTNAAFADLTPRSTAAK